MSEKISLDSSGLYSFFCMVYIEVGFLSRSVIDNEIKRVKMLLYNQ